MIYGTGKRTSLVMNEVLVDKNNSLELILINLICVFPALNDLADILDPEVTNQGTCVSSLSN